MLNYLLRSTKTKMFKKLVSGLPYSPALVGQLGFYARRLKKEEVTRRTGLVFTALALVVQSFAVFSPPEPANAANASNLIRGGVSSVEQILAVYDQSARGNGDYKAIMDYNGITRADLQGLKSTKVNSRQFGTGPDAIISWGRVGRFSESQGQVRHVIPVNGTSSTVYSAPLRLFDGTSYTIKNGSTYDAFVGTTSSGKWFAIQKSCGNLMTRETPTPVPSGQVIAADCRSIRGFAYDARQRNARVNVYLYFNGPPGRGERVGPIAANQADIASPVGTGYGFNVAVPEKYLKTDKPVQVYGVMIPLAGWNRPSVEIGSRTIPGNCNPASPVSSPAAACNSVRAVQLSRTRFNLAATAAASNGASVTGYNFAVKGPTGKAVYQKTVAGGNLTGESGVFDLNDAGTYAATATVKTSLGDKSSAACEAILTVAKAAAKPQTQLVLGKEVKNLTQNIADANGTTAKQGDRLEYTVYIENVGAVAAETTMKEELADVLEYASLQDSGTGQFNDRDKTLSWGAMTLKPDETQIRKFVVQINQIPATARGVSDPASYDCTISNIFGNAVTVNVECPTVKGIEQTVSELPSTGPTENIIFGGGLLMIVTYFYARSRQLGREVRLIRHDFNAGTL